MVVRKQQENAEEIILGHFEIRTVGLDESSSTSNTFCKYLPIDR